MRLLETWFMQATINEEVVIVDSRAACRAEAVKLVSILLDMLRILSSHHRHRGPLPSLPHSQKRPSQQKRVQNPSEAPSPGIEQPTFPRQTPMPPTQSLHSLHTPHPTLAFKP